ncbi:MAG: hypothetical protein NC548_63120 [Lachnospiraceae bacterium]|nr:hypothetical protein [Lachnospiraceae bacterium]
MPELNVKVGDKLLYSWGYVHNRVEKIVTVSKVTPTGRIRIEEYDERYDKYGNQMGNRDSWSCGSHLSIPTEEDYERIERKRIISKAMSLIGNIKRENLSCDTALKLIEILESEGKE